MVKLFIENTNTAESKKVRIFKLTNETQIIAPVEFTMTDRLGGSYGVLLPKLVVKISCADVPNETQKLQMLGLFTIKVDDVEIIGGGKEYTDVEIAQYYLDNNLDTTEGLPVAGYYWTQDEIAEYFKANQNDLGVTVDLHYEISCAGAPTRTACLTIEGMWDVYIADRLVSTDLTMSDVIEQLANEEVIAVDCNITVPTPEATSQLVTEGANYDFEVDGNIYTGVTFDELRSIAAKYGIEVLPLTDYAAVG